MRLSVVFAIVWGAYFALLNVGVDYEGALHPGAISLSGALGYELAAPILGIPLVFIAVQVVRWQRSKGRPAPALTRRPSATSLPSLSLYKGVDASYTVEGGRTSVAIRMDSRLSSKAVYVGTGQMNFWWKPNTFQRGSTWTCDVSMADPAAVQAEGGVTEDGRQEMRVDLGNVFPAGFILNTGMIGGLAAPAVRVEVQRGKDIWAYLLRRPWFPLEFQPERSALSVEHEMSRVTASLDVSDDGSLSAEVTMDGTGFKKASLIVRRSLGSYLEEEVVGEVTEGTRTFAWRPTTREVDFLLVTNGKLSSSQLVDIVGGLGADTSRGILGDGLKHGFVLCDVPAISYSLILKGHRGLLEDSKDQTGAKLAVATESVPAHQT
jgi:hypothetical protein